MKLRLAMLEGACLGGLTVALLVVCRWLIGWPSYLLLERECVWYRLSSVLPESLQDLIFRLKDLVFRFDSVSRFILIATNLIAFALAGATLGALLWSLFKNCRLPRLGFHCGLAAGIIAFSMFTVRYCPFTHSGFRESGDWREWKDKHLAVRIPATWGVKKTGLIEGNPKDQGVFGYQIKDSASRNILSIGICVNSSEFPHLMWAPIEAYSTYSDGDYRLFSYAPGSSEKILVIIEDGNMAYISITYRQYDTAMCDYIGETIRLRPR